MSDNSERIQDRIAKAAAKEIDSEINEVFDNLFNAGSDNSTLPEQVFVDKFLPFFSGKVKDSRDLNITTHWISIAGSPTKAVDVVNPSGVVLFTVPPLWATDFLQTKENIRGKTFNDIFTDAKQQSNRLQVLGEAIIEEQATGKVKDMNIEVKTAEQQQWQDIYRRYGVETTDLKEDTVKAQSASDDELEFD